MKDIHYKYRSLDNFRYFVDIILKNRLYAAKYKDLNDPMEGQYYYREGRLDRRIQKKLLGEKQELSLCSLSKVKHNHLMWSHYSNGHRGVVIGLNIEDNIQYTIKPIQYDGICSVDNQNYDSRSAEDILSHKLEVWNYEEEVRVFVKNSCFINIKIVEVITGLKVSNDDHYFIKDLVERINPTIKVIKAESFMRY